MVSCVITLVTNPDAILAPIKRKLIGDLTQNGVATRITPHNQVMSVNVSLADVFVILDSCTAAELTPPVIDGVVHLGVSPLAHADYKHAQNQLDDGLFGQSQILSAFNYRLGRVYGVEFSGSYAVDGFSSYANVAYSVAQGQDWNSAQFLHDPTALAYVQNHWIYLDHDQRVTGSFGAAYTWKEVHGSTRVYMDAIYGSGLRQDGGDYPTIRPRPSPMAPACRPTTTVNMGVEQDMKLDKTRVLKVRLDVVNIADNVYELRSGTGVGVNAPQLGMRRGIFGSLGLAF